MPELEIESLWGWGQLLKSLAICFQCTLLSDRHNIEPPWQVVYPALWNLDLLLCSLTACRLQLVLKQMGCFLFISLSLQF